MVATIASPLAVGVTPFNHRRLTPSFGIVRWDKRLSSSSRRSAVLTSSEQNSAPVQASSSDRERGAEKILELAVELNRLSPALDEEDPGVSENLNAYFEQAAVLAHSTGDGGGPRWFCPVECGRPRLKGAPLLLYLPVLTCPPELTGLDAMMHNKENEGDDGHPRAEIIASDACNATVDEEFRKATYECKPLPTTKGI